MIQGSRLDAVLNWVALQQGFKIIPTALPLSTIYLLLLNHELKMVLKHITPMFSRPYLKIDHLILVGDYLNHIRTQMKILLIGVDC